jgi:hypothetical protein
VSSFPPLLDSTYERKCDNFLSVSMV